MLPDNADTAKGAVFDKEIVSTGRIWIATKPSTWIVQSRKMTSYIPKRDWQSGLSLSLAQCAGSGYVHTESIPGRTSSFGKVTDRSQE